MCDKFFESIGVSEDVLYSGGGSLNLIHQLGGKVEGGFLAHFILNQFFRKYSSEKDNARVLLILNHHSKFHWASVGSKLGTNINLLEEKGRLITIDILREMYDGIKSNQLSSSGFDIPALFNRCDEAIQNFRKAGSRKILVIVEDLTNFLNTGCATNCETFADCEKTVLEFLLKLRSLSIMCSEESECAVAITSLVQSPDKPTDAMEQTRFTKTISQALPSILFEVSPLITGFSQQVTGFLKVTYKPKQTAGCKNIEQRFIKNYHFKLDNNSARATPF